MSHFLYLSTLHLHISFLLSSPHFISARFISIPPHLSLLLPPNPFTQTGKTALDLAPDGPVKDMLKAAGVEAIKTQAIEAARTAVPLEVRVQMRSYYAI